MGEINIPHDQQDALTAIDDNELDRLIEQAIREERSGDLRRLPLASCGSYIATQLRYFEQALTDPGAADFLGTQRCEIGRSSGQLPRRRRQWRHSRRGRPRDLGAGSAFHPDEPPYLVLGSEFDPPAV
jgi:hypothetical protein